MAKLITNLLNLIFVLQSRLLILAFLAIFASDFVRFNPKFEMGGGKILDFLSFLKSAVS